MVRGIWRRAEDSEPTVKLITKTLAIMAADKTIGRSEALRRIERGTPHEAHPAYWGPFVVVGEGAASIAATPLPQGRARMSSTSWKNAGSAIAREGRMPASR
jgi:hypothetical protein